MNIQRAIYIVAVTLLVIGGINWGLVGLFDLNLVERIFNFIPLLVRLIYILVAIAAVYVAIAFFTKIKLQFSS